MNNNSRTFGIVILGLFIAIILVLANTPLGYIPLGFMRATTIHIPVIIASVVLGPKKGAFLGFVFGLTSLLNNTFNPTATSFVFSPFYSVGGVGGNFWSLVICFLPRILVGVVPCYVYKLIKGKSSSAALLCAGLAGSLTNTILVMHFIYLFFGSAYAAATERSIETLYTAILVIIGTNGVPEAVIAALLTFAVCKALTMRKER